MDLEEQQQLIANNNFPTKQTKPPPQIKYTKEGYLNYLLALLTLIILGLMSAIVIDITGYGNMHLTFTKNHLSQKIQQQDVKNENNKQEDNYDYTNNLDNLIWDDNNNNNNVQKNYQNVTITDIENNQQEVSLDNDESIYDIENDEVNINQIDEITKQNQPNFQSATFEIGTEEEKQIIQEQAEVYDADQQLEQYSLLQTSQSIITPIIDKKHFSYAKLPNNMRILFIENNQTEAQLILDIFQGFWDTNYYLQCDQCDMIFSEHQTQYEIKTQSEQIINQINYISQQFLEQNQNLKTINKQDQSFDSLLSILANENHPFSYKYKQKQSSFIQSPQNMVLIIEGNIQPNKIMDEIIQSDIVLLRDKDQEQQEEIPMFDKFGYVVKWNDAKELNSIRILYQLKNYQNINFLNYFVQTSLKQYVINNKLGLDLKSMILKEENQYLLYQILIELPFQDQMDYDERELAYRLGKIIINFAQQLSLELINDDKLSEYCQQMIDQLQQINNLQFDFSLQPLNYLEIANNLMKDQVEEALHYQYLIQIDYSTLKETLIEFTNVENLFIIVTDQQYRNNDYSFAQIHKGSSSQDLIFLTKDELNINTNNIFYSLKELTEQTKIFMQANDENIKFEFPQINEFIPQHFDLVEQNKAKQINQKLYIQPDIETKMPIITTQIDFMIYGQIIYAQYLNERFMMQYQSAIDVGYKFEVIQGQYFSIQITGWSDQFQKIFKGVSDIIKEKPDEELHQQLESKFNSLPEHLKLIQYNIDSYIISNYKVQTFGIIGTDYNLQINGNINEEQSISIQEILDKALNLKQNMKSKQIKFYDLTNQKLNYQIQSKDKWQVLVKYYQFINLNKKQLLLFEKVVNQINQNIQEQRIILQQRTLACTNSIFLIKQSTNQLNDENENMDQFIETVLNQIKSKKVKKFWSQYSGQINFFIENNNNSETINQQNINFQEIECI